MSEAICPICGSLPESEKYKQLKKEYGELKVKELKILLENAALQKRIAELETQIQTLSQKMCSNDFLKEYLVTPEITHFQCFVCGHAFHDNKYSRKRPLCPKCGTCDDIRKMKGEIPQKPETKDE